MNLRKRSRLEMELGSIATTTELSDAGTSATTSGTYSYSEGGGGGGGSGTLTTTNGLFLSSSGVENMNAGAQIFLTICGDENSDESQEAYYAIGNNALPTDIKQEEPDLDLHAFLPTNLQLPSGCDIYLVKDTMVSLSPSPNLATITAKTKAYNGSEQLMVEKHSLATIKMEPDTIADNVHVNKFTPSTNVLFVSGNGNSNGNGSVVPCAISSPTNQIFAAVEKSDAVSSPTAGPANGFKLDAYKKRDDKRRATHNEVERRRRDKINCWIFKLKEMLPTDGNRYSSPIANSNPLDSNRETTTPIKNNSNNGRTPPNDSKSQILIKACDYIKTMQNEIDNLRECLKEAESLRQSNQALRDELNNLKQRQERYNNASGSFNVTLNSLNSSSSATSDLFEGIDTSPNLATVSSISFSKRGLMITDYDE